MKRFYLFILMSISIHQSQKLLSQTITPDKLIGKWESTDFQFQAKKSVWLNQFFSTEPMKKAQEVNASRHFLHFIDNSSAKADFSFYFENGGVLNYEIKLDEHNVPFIHFIQPNEQSYFKSMEIISCSDNELVLVEHEKIYGTDNMERFKQLMPANETIEEDEEMLTKITFSRVIEAPWSQSLNISKEIQENMIQIDQMENQLLIWYIHSKNDDPFSSPNQYLTFFKSINNGQNWEKSEIPLSSEEFVNKLVLTRNGVLIFSGSSMKFLKDKETKPSEIKVDKYPEEFTCCFSSAHVESKGDSLVMTLEKSLWISSNGGKSWEKSSLEKLNDASEFKNIWFTPKGEVLTEIMSHNQNSGGSTTYLLIAPCFGKEKTTIKLPQNQHNNEGNKYKSPYYYFEEPKCVSFDYSGNLYIVRDGEMLTTSDFGNTYHQFELPSCKKKAKPSSSSNDNIDEMYETFSGGNSLSLLFSKNALVSVTDCGIWYKMNNDDKWVLAKNTNLKNIESSLVFVFDDVITALGNDQILYSLKLSGE